MMRFRETDALLREAESRDNLAAALKGGTAAKEFRKEREALERAAGGTKKLAAAERVLADAHSEASALVAKAKADGVLLSRAAADDIKAGTTSLDGRRQDLDERQIRLNEMKAGLDATATGLKDDLIDLKAREKAADALDSALLRREAEVTSRETNTTAREAEIKRFDAWRATAPA